jgi:hypothetical protein
MSNKLKPLSPGEMLAEEFLKPLGLSNMKPIRGPVDSELWRHAVRVVRPGGRIAVIEPD